MFDVAIIGGGPAGASLASLLLRYAPNMRVLVLERETFPRDHVGESLLPHLMQILHEMGVWDKVEAADFPVKIGGRYRWGRSDDHWPIDFVPDAAIASEHRPGTFAGPRKMTAFQVDRAKYDKILLDHARELGADVREATKVQTVHRDGDRVQGLDIVGPDGIGERITARYYVDASGNSALLRRTMGVEVDSPTALRNIAIWDYWQNAEWAERIGVGGTRILVMSVEWGWLWFIPLGPTRTSLGLVTPAEYAKASGKRPEELYMEAIASEPTIRRLVQSGTRENLLQTTKDWSFVASRLCGENWFLAGDASGFADPILSAGLTLAQSGARRVAYTILEMDREETDGAWLRHEYERTQSAQIRSHIRFADYWYSANRHFTELKEYCSEIAREAGVHLEPDQAFRWLGTGGFATDNLAAPNLGMFSIGALKLHIQEMTGERPQWHVEENNVFSLDLAGAEETLIGIYEEGRIHQVKCWVRDNHILPDYKLFGAMKAALEKETDLPLLMERFALEAGLRGVNGSFWSGLQTLEGMIGEGWVKGCHAPDVRSIRIILRVGYLAIGWLDEGVGLRSVLPQARNRIEVSWEDYERELV